MDRWPGFEPPDDEENLQGESPDDGLLDDLFDDDSLDDDISNGELAQGDGFGSSVKRGDGSSPGEQNSSGLAGKAGSGGESADKPASAASQAKSAGLDAANKAVGEAGIDLQKIKDAAATEGGKVSKAANVAAEIGTQAAEKYVTAQAGQLAGKATGVALRNKHVRRALVFSALTPFVMPIVLVLVVGILLASLLGGSDFPDPSEKTRKDISETYLAAYMDAAENNDIPWTVLAAIGKIATEHGRYSPYDEWDRDPAKAAATAYRGYGSYAQTPATPENGVLSTYTCFDGRCGVFPAIGDKPGQARGPLLITAEGLAELSRDPARADTMAQDINQAAEYIALKMAQARDELIAEDAGAWVGWESDPTVADKFWTAVLARLPIADPSGEIVVCTPDKTQPVSLQIKYMMRCEMSGKVLRVVSNMSSTGTPTVLTGSRARDTLVREALAVSYAFSRWGEDDCDNTTYTGGVFPLTKTQAKVAEINRCNKDENIALAVKLLVAGEGVDPSLRPRTQPYEPMLGGWRQFPGALGSAAAIDTFITTGPPRATSVSSSCSTVITSWLDNIARANPSVLTNSTETALTDVRYGLPEENPACTGMTSNSYIWADAKAAAAAALLNDANEAASATPSADVVAYRDAIRAASGVLNTWVTEIARYKGWAVSSAVARLSSTGLGTSYPALPAAGADVPTTAFFSRIITQAIAYGGTYPGDNRYDPDADPSMAGVATLGLTLYIDNSLVTDPWKTPFETLNYSGCGSPSNTNDYSRPVIVTLFERMCGVAEVEGAHIRITSSTRTNAEQVALFKKKGAALAAEPAKSIGPNTWVGGSPHEKGIALDIDTGYGGAIEWMHTIVGCFNESTTTYVGYDIGIGRMAYADAVEEKRDTVKDLGGAQRKVCGSGWVPVKRVNTFGLAILCLTPKSRSMGDTLSTPAVIRCQGTMPSGFTREEWHIQPGIAIMQLQGGAAVIGVAPEAVLSAIHSAFPESQWNNALAVAQAESRLNSAAKGGPNSDGSFDWGLFQLNDHGTLQGVYVRIALNRSATQADYTDPQIKQAAITWAMDPVNNAKGAYLLWVSCDWWKWAGARNVGLAPKTEPLDYCNPVGKEQRAALPVGPSA